MSKVFKSEQCIEALPCRLEIIGADAFFIKQKTAEEAAVSEDNVHEEQNVVFNQAVEAQETLEEAQQEAEEIIRTAQKTVELMLEEAKQQSENIRVEAKLLASNEGRQEGLNQIKQELSDYLIKALALLSEAETAKEQRIMASEPELLKLAIAIAEKIIDAELSENVERKLQIVKKALQRVSGVNQIKIRINPDDLATVSTDNLVVLQQLLSEPKPIIIEADPGISSGGCFVETEQGNVDARIKSQLEIITRELLKVGELK